MALSTGEHTSGLRGPAPREERASFGQVLAALPVVRIAGLGLLAIVLAFLSVYPLSMLLYGSLHSTPPGMAGTFNLDGYRDVITLQSAVTLLNTVGISLAKTIPSVILAVLLAWILARTDTP